MAGPAPCPPQSRLTHRQPQEGTVKKGLHRPRLNAIIPILTAPTLILIAAPFSSRLSRYMEERVVADRVWLLDEGTQRSLTAWSRLSMVAKQQLASGSSTNAQRCSAGCSSGLWAGWKTRRTPSGTERFSGRCQPALSICRNQSAGLGIAGGGTLQNALQNADRPPKNRQ